MSRIKLDDMQVNEELSSEEGKKVIGGKGTGDSFENPIIASDDGGSDEFDLPLASKDDPTKGFDLPLASKDDPTKG